MDIKTKFLKLLVGVWAKELNATEDYVKWGVQGKPLFRTLRKRTLPADIKDFPIICEGKNAYLQMIIGNAPWPIGVSVVGIHAQMRQEKVFSKHMAHVHHDKTQREYVQGLKRLMTICQKCFPTDPSVHNALELHCFILLVAK
uniref:Pre-mRNA-splicing factor 18 n=1 Tax=Cyanistes caeruleus TaxID=156563 RepID=A0A8C0ZJV0_CYACU